MIAQRAARTALQIPFPAERSSPTPTPEEAVVQGPREPTAENGSAVAVLSIPRIQLSSAVLHGSDAKTLRRGPGHLENTAYPGETGNVVIAGHRDSFFLPLRNIRVGDDVYLDTQKGRFHYQVASLRVVSPRDLSVLAANDEATLTLITCYPFWVLGNAPDRFVVRATRVGAPPVVPLEARQLPLISLDTAPSIDAAKASERASSAVPVADDDESLVREAVGRYLLIQGGSRAFNCDVSFGEERATADCDPLAPSSSELLAHGRTFLLERSNDTWAIRSIVLK
jgi:sortase A